MSPPLLNSHSPELASRLTFNATLPAEPTLEQRKVIYRARRGLKELDYYLDPYIRQHYLTADGAEQAVFARLIEQEDPDLLDWFLNNTPAPDVEMGDLIAKLKRLKG